MFELTAEEATRLSEREDIQLVLQLKAASVQQGNRAQGATWPHLVFDPSA